MKVSPFIFCSLAAALIAGCENNRGNAGSAAGAESGTMQGSEGAGVESDTGATGTGATGTGAGGAGDTTANQSQSGVTDSRTGESTLGEGATTSTPDQGQPTTSKGDTIERGGDTVTAAPR